MKQTVPAVAEWYGLEMGIYPVTKFFNYYDGMPIDLYAYTVYIEFPFVCFKSAVN